MPEALGVEIILGKERRRWSRAQKVSIAAETFAPDVVILDIAKRHQISSGQIHTWRKHFRAELGFPAPPEPPPRFMPLAIASDCAPTTIEAELAGGARLRITGTLDASVMTALVKALAQKPR